MRTPRPPLDYFLLGLIAATPASGYDLRKIFHDSALRTYSDSPGSVYPALRRLESARLIAGRTTDRARRRRTFAITAKGRTEFMRWLSTPLTLEQLTRNTGEAELQLAFLSDHLPLSALRTFLKHLADLLDEQRAQVAAVRRTIGDQLSLSGGLALDLGLASISARAAWCRQTLRRRQSS